jgi:hypothetical protein
MGTADLDLFCNSHLSINLFSGDRLVYKLRDNEKQVTMPHRMAYVLCFIHVSQGLSVWGTKHFKIDKTESEWEFIAGHLWRLTSFCISTARNTSLRALKF